MTDSPDPAAVNAGVQRHRVPKLIVQPCNSDDLRHRVAQTELVDVDAFIRDGYVVVTVPRMIAQPAFHAQEEFAIDGSDPSPVARAIVAGLASGRRARGGRR